MQPTGRPRPIGILGGTFDPIHYGHLRPALEAWQALKLQQVRLIPAGLPPHRRPPVASPAQRLAMVRAAVADEPAFAVDPRELERPGPSYTVDTLASLRAELPDTPLCLLLGSDAFAGLPSWHHWTELIALSHLVVLERPGTLLAAQEAVVQALQGRYTDAAERLARCPAGLVLRLAVTALDISASRIRALVSAGVSPRYLLPDAVWTMIRREGIYT